MHMETIPRHLLIEDQTVPSEMGTEQGYEVTRAEGRKGFPPEWPFGCQPASLQLQALPQPPANTTL